VESNRSQKDDSIDVSTSVNNTNKNETTENQTALEGGNETREAPREQQICQRCGKVGHASNAFPDPMVCSRCHKEGHVARIYTTKIP
jgi:uncharacterized paraquat-inducible protein A